MGRSSDESPLRRITAESCLLGGAGHAVLLQIAHPSVAHGVLHHSDFEHRPFSRLFGTLAYVYGTVYGTEAERERLHAIVRATHKKVTGPGYRALDDDLLLWVAATLCHNAARLHTMVFDGFRDRDEYALFLREASVLGTALGLPESAWPGTPEEFDAYWEKAVSGLKVGDEARDIAHRLFRPRQPVLRALMPLQRLLTTGLLPPDLREGFGLPWSPRRQRVFDAVIGITRTVYPRLPRPLRVLPATVCLWSIRRREAARLSRRTVRPGPHGRARRRAIPPR
ncbi:oxygenase MpaB family protein [Nocardiopsis sp. N85]|uniref:oxygenase MpaB family protein n=1 Tax=Nocardiopsis sp. N85 TaxID=3029400 RepID=UPI00237F923E|nr:oxygenase MpaB family protein [Nocardiopsis sp. N85]MDE3724484.1 oxygenase MpaB family protein [Nocardiopsis sp. N85]